MVSHKWHLKTLLFFLLFQFNTSIYIITPTKPFKDGDILVSNGGHFALGFFSPGNSSNRYIGIWYNKVPEQTVVWVANRENPIKDSKGLLTINEDGNLVVISGDQKTSLLWSTNISITINTNTTATLLDNGNLVLTQDNNKRVLWQSFDYPTHTFLPGMKFGLDRKTGLNRQLTSWTSDENPARGDLISAINPNGSPQFFMYKGTARLRLWRSGPWNGIRLSGIPTATDKSLSDHSFVNNKDEIYYNYSIYNPSIYCRFVLGYSGSATYQGLIWYASGTQWTKFWAAPMDPCDNYAQCGAYGSCNPNNNGLECTCLPGFVPKSPTKWHLKDGSGGCVRKNRSDQLKCGKGDGFLTLASVKLPDTSVAVRVDPSLSLTACGDECLRNCSCTAYASADINAGGSGCVSWYGALIDIREYTVGGQDLYIRVDATELAAHKIRNSKGVVHKGVVHKRWLIVIPLVSGLLLLLSFGFCFLKKRKSKRAIMENNGPELSLCDFSGSNSMRDPAPNEFKDLAFFDLSVVEAATNNFSSVNLLGQGGFGPVYKGKLFNGQEVAVKRLSKTSGQGIEEFKNEVTLIAKLQHRNLVRLLGCCIQGEEKILIYEYMPNKSLDLIIFDESKRTMLDWRKRFEIILGIARGILYLHQDSRLRIVHRDLKTGNVLLDEEMSPKISDFGMARIFGSNQTEAYTRRVVGTYGYMSPEYALDGAFSTKSDVFSFGVIMLEIISGKKSTSYYREDTDLNLIGHAWKLWKEGKAMEILDSSMADQCPALEVLRCIKVGLLCVQESTSDRPKMSTVVFMLENETAMPLPKQPAFFIRKSTKDQDPSTSGTGSCSINEVSITMEIAR